MTELQGKIVKVHQNKMCSVCDIVFKSASGKRVHDQTVHGVNNGMIAGSPRQRQFMQDMQYTIMLELIIEKREISISELYSQTKLPASNVFKFLQQLASQGLVKMTTDNNVENDLQKPRKVCLVDQSIPSFK